MPLDFRPYSWTSFAFRIACLTLLVIGLIGTVSPAPLDAAPRAHWCECVEFVKNSFDLHGAAGNAKDMAPFLAAHGFRRADAPVVGGVVIVQPAYYTHGDGAVYGHVGLIESVAAAGKSGWFVGIRSANQTGSPFSGAGCSNVTFKSFGPFPRTGGLVTYWLPPRR